MAGINFAKKGLNQKIFSKKQLRATVGRKSSAFTAIMGNKEIAHVMDKAAERRVFYDALQKRGKSAGTKGITKNVLKRVLGDIEHSGQFSHKEMHKLGEELIGGAANSRIIREHAPKHAESHVQADHQPSRVVDSHKTYAEILQKDVTDRSGNLSVQKAFEQKASFVKNTDAIRRAKEFGIVAASASDSLQKNSAENFGYIPNHLKNFNKGADIGKVKSMLARIQDRNDNEEEDGIRLAA